MADLWICWHYFSYINKSQGPTLYSPTILTLSTNYIQYFGLVFFFLIPLLTLAINNLVAITLNTEYVIPSVIFIIYIVLSLSCIGYLYLCDARKYFNTHQKIRKRIAPIFSRCSSIESLYVKFPDHAILKVYRKILDDVHIRNLLIFNLDCNEQLRFVKSILQQITRNFQESTDHYDETSQNCECNNCRRLLGKRKNGFVFSSLLKVEMLETDKHRHNSDKFFRDITETVKTLHIYEWSNRADKIFGKPREFWENEARTMADGSYSFQVSNGLRCQIYNLNCPLRFKIDKIVGVWDCVCFYHSREND